MKKVININFQGRVVPIEESAYEILKQYTESLRRFFANEEGKDEIINDIEGRIAELFGEKLKKGKTCITDEDVNSIINSMGRPEDFEADEAKVQSQFTADDKTNASESTSGFSGQEQTATPHRGRLYRDMNDKMLGGVCGGIANYLRMDPSIVRILFAIITFGGFGAGVVIYILLWIILPSKALNEPLRKRLFRNTDEKIIAGVASGIASYFNIALWIPRTIFALPLILAIFGSVFSNMFHSFDPFPPILFGSFGSSLFIIYIVLWAVIPQAVTASEKLEMRGEKVDLNTIKTTIQTDLEGLQQRTSAFAAEAGPVLRKTGGRFWNAIGILFKGFFLLVAGCIAFALLMVMLWFMVDRVSLFPVKDYFLDGVWQNTLAWTTLILFLGIPVVALITWLIRRLTRVKSHNPYLGYTFGGLWFIGLVAAIMLASSIASNYRTRAAIEERISMQQPPNEKLYVRVYPKSIVNYYGSDWYGIHWDDDDAPFYALSEDSVMMRTIQVRVVRSDDSMYHAHLVKFGRGSNPTLARQTATKIDFNISQQDSLFNLPQGFALTKNEKFRNQQVLVVIEVPVNKKIQLDRSLDDYEWINIELHDYDNRGWNLDWDDNWENSYSWRTNKEYVMTENGLRPTRFSDEDLLEMENENMEAEEELQNIQERKMELERQQQELERSLQRDSSLRDTTRYEYKRETPARAVVKQSALSGNVEGRLMDVPLNSVKRFFM